MKTTLHHLAYNIKPDTLEIFLELMKKFNCVLDYRAGDARWCMIAQRPNPINIQIIETTDKNIPLKKKINTHLAFLSDTPREDIEEIKKWTKEKNLKFKQDSWTDRELWFDLPEIFTNFVIEIMHTSVAD